MTTIDLTNVNRFKNVKNDFVTKILHPDEINIYKSIENKKKFLAIRWAIKEALFKNNNKYYQYNRILIHKNNNIYTFENFNISTSSEDNYIIVLVEKEK